MTHTYVILELSFEAFREIASNLEAAGYHHAFSMESGKETYDMHGIAVQPRGDFDYYFRDQLDWFMCSDPWPTTMDLRERVENMLDEKSKLRGYSNWIDAFHKYKETADEKNLDRKSG